MKRLSILVTLALLACGPQPPARAAEPHAAEPKAATTPRASSAPARPTVSKRSPAPRARAVPSAHKPAPRHASTRTTATTGGHPTRRLEEIPIEGEIPVPQVLFITARDQRRFLESHHARYLRTSRELAKATTLPARVAVVDSSGAAPEPQR